MTMSSAENSPVHASKAAGRSWSSSNDAATKMASPLCVPSSLYTTVTFSTTIFEFTVRAAISSCAPTHMRYSTISGASVCCTRGTSFGCASPRVRPSAAPSRHPSRTASQVLKKSSRGQNSIVMADGSCSFFCDNCPSDNVTVYNCAQPSKPGRRVESRMTGASSASRASAEGGVQDDAVPALLPVPTVRDMDCGLVAEETRVHHGDCGRGRVRVRITCRDHTQRLEEA